VVLRWYLHGGELHFFERSDFDAVVWDFEVIQDCTELRGSWIVEVLVERDVVSVPVGGRDVGAVDARVGVIGGFFQAFSVWIRQRYDAAWSLTGDCKMVGLQDLYR